ncbi:hypothetical protein ACFZBU_35730 [Embleya sp. NPDC008237]|uniref:hypothetical protein n=1 Tax=Embleya sp. NPDC008237 TaxID=3363978 RepID=UPI0036EE2264
MRIQLLTGGRTRSLWPAAALALAFALTGCGSDDGDEDRGVASAAGKNAPQAAASAAPSLSRDEMGVKYAECMRKNGVSMEDPLPGQGVTLKLDGSVPKETVTKAEEACRTLAPQGQAGPGGDAESEERGRKFAACMRENGVQDFPDPEPGQRGVRMERGTQEDPEFEAAIEKCRPLMGGGAK